MKKNRMMRVASALLVAVLLTTCAISGTFAKYITAEDATDSAAQAKPVPMNKNSMMLVFGAIALIGVGGAGFFLMKKKNGAGNSKSAMQDEPEYDDDNEITEDEDDMKFYDDQDDEI